MRKAIVSAACILAACTGEPGDPGPQGAPGTPGPTGAPGPAGQPASASDGSAPKPVVTWVDADGTVIPSVSTELGGFGELSFVPFFDSSGVIWSLRADGEVLTAKDARRYFVGSTCSGAVYTYGIPPGVSFGILGGSAPLLAYPANVALRDVPGFDSYKEIGSDTCIAQGFTVKRALAVIDAVPVALPPAFKPPYRLERR